jgi:3-dehydroquinate synthase
MSTTHYGFDLSHQFPVAFTSGVFAPDNPSFADAIVRGDRSRSHRLLVIVDSGVASTHPNLNEDIAAYCDRHAPMLALATPAMVTRGGEAAKFGMDPALDVVGWINTLGIDRQSYVVAIGGGAVLDMVSFAAAIAHRGVRVVRVPTTTLAQGDSGFAVKNGVNLFGKKNFVGTFVPPWAVVNGAEFLRTLAPRDRRCGLAEAVKVAVLKDSEFFAWLEANASLLGSGDADAMQAAVERSAELHLAHICGNGDPFELGSARPLDFGHWSAHKLEAISNHEVKHGEAVAIGMALDVRYCVHAGLLNETDAGRILATLTAMGFHLDHPALLTRGPSGALTIIDGLQEFREHLGGELTITLLHGIGRPFEAHHMDLAHVQNAIDDLRALSPA